MAKRRQAPSRYKNSAFLRGLGTYCRRLRKKKGYSIDRMAREGDQLSPGAIQRLEMGEADVHVSLLHRYASVLAIPVSSLFGFEKERESLSQVIPIESQASRPKQSVPFYALEVAAGTFGLESLDLDPQGWVVVDKRTDLTDYFSARVYGKSMEPTIPDGSICLFKKYSGGTRQGKIMLVQARGLQDPENGFKFVIKRYNRLTKVGESESREKVTIELVSDNPRFNPIVLRNLHDGDIATPAQFIQVLSTNE